jgi:uncharacterized membrane-anchored protein
MRNPLVALCLATACLSAFAQSTPDEKQRLAQSLKWLEPGKVGSIDGKAQFKTSAAYTFLGTSDTDTFLKLNGNPPPGNAYTIAPTKADWFGILTFAPEGYVKDDEKIDADELLKSLKERNIAGNEKKQKAGYEPLMLEGWAIPPRYDAENKRLEWGTKLRNPKDNSLVVNVSTRILGRSGHTAAILVTSPETVEKDLADFKQALKSFDYVSGEKYSEWKQGDKVAAYGLGALVLGGAAAAATSKGFLKAVGLGILAAVAAVWSGVKRLISRVKV